MMSKSCKIANLKEGLTNFVSNFFYLLKKYLNIKLINYYFRKFMAQLLENLRKRVFMTAQVHFGIKKIKFDV